MKIVLLLFAGLILSFPFAFAFGQVSMAKANTADQQYASQQDKLVSFAKCLGEKGYRMYSSFTCSHCNAQRKSFGNAFSYINEIECNPVAPNNQVELCLKNNIRKLPTWIQIVENRELIRLEGYQRLEILSASSGCEY